MARRNIRVNGQNLEDLNDDEGASRRPLIPLPLLARIFTLLMIPLSTLLMLLILWFLVFGNESLLPVLPFASPLPLVITLLPLLILVPSLGPRVHLLTSFLPPGLKNNMGTFPSTMI